MSPAKIKILLHYYAHVDDYTYPDGRRFVTSTIEELMCDGLMQESLGDERMYDLTPMGKFYVKEGLCSVPLPVTRFVIPSKHKREEANYYMGELLA